jgi:hypothetical protein
MLTRGSIFGGIAPAMLTRVRANNETGRAPAFESHGPAAVGLAIVPGNIIESAFSADDGMVWFHDMYVSDDRWTIAHGKSSWQAISPLFKGKRKDRF